MARPSTSVSRRHACGLLGGCLAGFCSGLLFPPGLSQAQIFGLSPEEERQAGADSHPRMIQEFGGVYDDPQLGGYVAVIGAQLAATTGVPLTQFTFTLLDSPTVNAFATPGGYIYVTRGLAALATSEAELSSILGHELGHAVARHTSQQHGQGYLARVLTGGLSLAGVLAGMTPTGTDLVGRLGGVLGSVYLQSYSREQEFEADALGIAYMSRAGFTPLGAPRLLSKLGEQGRLMSMLAGRPPDAAEAFDIMATHPQTAERVERAAEAADQAGTGGRLGEQEYLDNIEGMVFGEDPDEGVLQGRTFMHRGLGFRFDVPPGFRVGYRSDTVIALPPGQDRIVMLFERGDPRFAGTMTQYVQSRAPVGTRLREVEHLAVNGMEAGTGWYEGATDYERVDVRFVAIRMDRSNVYCFRFIAPLRDMARLSRDFRDTTYSFRSLTPGEAAGIQPRRVRTVTVADGDTVDGLAARMQTASHGLEWFRVLNGLQPGEELRRGARVKLVV